MDNLKTPDEIAKYWHDCYLPADTIEGQLGILARAYLDQKREAANART